MNEALPPGLKALAALYGIETSYMDMGNQMVHASTHAVLKTLSLLDNRITDVEDVEDAIQRKIHESAKEITPCVAVAWNGEGSVEITLPKGTAFHTLSIKYILENGDRMGEDREWSSLPNVRETEVLGDIFETRSWKHPKILPTGYHQMFIEMPSHTREVFIISAPEKCYTPPKHHTQKTWGIFVPLYSLQSKRNFGIGDLGDLKKLAQGVQKLGASFVSILPVLASYLEKPFQPSPYAPVSRFMWNEIFTDMTSVPEMKRSRKAKRILQSAIFQRSMQKIRSSAYVDYKRVYAWKKRILKLLSEEFFRGASPLRQKAFQKFLLQNPDVEEYAKFRSQNKSVRNYHQYVQWIFHNQIAGMVRSFRKKGMGLYLDLPMGVYSEGFDVKKYPDLFVANARVGAPPDTLFIHGQDWGFRPIHPAILQKTRYEYLRKVLSHHLRVCQYLRMDHVMQLYRLFWIPEGSSPRDGVYVRYPHEEMTAILSVESHRHQAVIIGENLGIVPKEVDHILHKHNIFGMFVLQYALGPDIHGLRNSLPEKVIACLNTHDMFPFKAYWTAEDISTCVERGILSTDWATVEKKRREEIVHNVSVFYGNQKTLTPEQAFEKLLQHLAGSQAQLVVLNLEDMLHELEPQNIPGTTTEYPNWQKKLLLPLDSIFKLPSVLEVCKKVDNERRYANR